MLQGPAHHFIPVFLLKQWHSPHEKPHLNDRLVAFGVKHGRLVFDRHKAASVAYVPGLYSTPLYGDDHENDFEKIKLQKIDSDAAVVHQLLLANAREFNRPQWEAWSRFVASLMVRAPKEVANYQEFGLQSIRRLMSDDDPSPTVRDGLPGLLKHGDEALAREVNIGGISGFLSDSRVLRVLCESEWALRDVGGASSDLLIGDNAIIRSGPLGAPYFIALPISPTKIFIVHNGHPSVENFTGQSDDEMVRLTNESTASQARQAIFATGLHHTDLVQSYLPKSALS